VTAFAGLADHERADSGGVSLDQTSAYSESSKRALWLESAVKSRIRDAPQLQQPSQSGLVNLISINSSLIEDFLRRSFRSRSAQHFLRHISFPNSLILLVVAGRFELPTPSVSLLNFYRTRSGGKVHYPIVK